MFRNMNTIKECSMSREESLEAAMNEVIRRSNLLIHQNIGRWNMNVEHDKRSYDVVSSNIAILVDALRGDIK